MRLSRQNVFSLVALAVGVAWAAPAAAVEITGQVRNATTGQPVAGASVNLLALRGMMVPIRETQTNQEGRYRFVVAANPSERFLVQVPFQGVNYHAPAFVTGERITADVEVYESGAAPSDISVEGHTIFLEPHSDHVRVTESYAVHNHSQPLRTFAPDGSSFTFPVPATVGDLQVSVRTVSGVPLRQQPQPAEAENHFAIDYAFRPGESEVQVSYAVPLSGTTLDLLLPLTVETKTRHIAVPASGVQLSGAGLEEIEQTRFPQTRLFSVSGAAPGELALRLQVDLEALPAVASSPQPSVATVESVVTIVPHPINRAQSYIVGLCLFVLLLGLYYLNSLQPTQNTSDDSARQPPPTSAD